MTSKIVVNNIEADAGVSTVTFGSNIQGNLIGNVTGNVTGTVNSSGIATFSSGLVVSAGSTSAPSISPSGDSNTGIFFPSADTIAFAEGGVEALRIDSSGRVGIATATMGYQLDVLRQGGETDVARVKGNLGNGFIRFANSNETSHWTLGADGGYPSGSNNNSFILYDRVNGQYRLAVDNSGNLTVNSGNIVIGTSGKGIDFSATSQAAGMTSELLTDYEEGTWTPTLGGTATYTVQIGTYTKIGRLIYVSAMLTVNTIGTGFTKEIQGLPFSINGNNNDIGPAIGYINNAANSYVSLGAAAYNNSIVLEARTAASTGSSGSPVFGNGTAVRVTMMYFT